MLLQLVACRHRCYKDQHIGTGTVTVTSSKFDTVTVAVASSMVSLLLSLQLLPMVAGNK